MARYPSPFDSVLQKQTRQSLLAMNNFFTGESPLVQGGTLLNSKNIVAKGGSIADNGATGDPKSTPETIAKSKERIEELKKEEDNNKENTIENKKIEKQAAEEKKRFEDELEKEVEGYKNKGITTEKEYAETQNELLKQKEKKPTDPLEKDCKDSNMGNKFSSDYIYLCEEGLMQIKLVDALGFLKDGSNAKTKRDVTYKTVLDNLDSFSCPQMQSCIDSAIYVRTEEAHNLSSAETEKASVESRIRGKKVEKKINEDEVNKINEDKGFDEKNKKQREETREKIKEKIKAFRSGEFTGALSRDESTMGLNRLQKEIDSCFDDIEKANEKIEKINEKIEKLKIEIRELEKNLIGWEEKIDDANLKIIAAQNMELNVLVNIPKDCGSGLFPKVSG